MNRKSLLIVLAGIVFIIAALNVSLNITQRNLSTSLKTIESLSNENLYEEYMIYLHGLLATIHTKSYSSSSSQLFDVVKYSSHINVNYLANLNNITVKIINSSGPTVYYNVVNPVYRGQLSISLAGLSSGYYAIVFSNTNSSVYGNFEI
jgi:hypothetical protein